MLISFQVESVVGNNLTLNKLSRADGGAYLCIANNQVIQVVGNTSRQYK